MFKKVILAAFVASIAGMLIFYLFFDLLGSQIILKGAYCACEKLWRHPELLSKNISRLLKYFCAFLLMNTLWAYVFSVRQKTFNGTGIEKGIKFFFLLWLLILPIHCWSWILIPFSKRILIYDVFVYYLVLFLATGAIVGKICSEEID